LKFEQLNEISPDKNFGNGLYTMTIHNNAIKRSTILRHKLRVPHIINRSLLSMELKGLPQCLLGGQDMKIERREKILVTNFGPKTERKRPLRIVKRLCEIILNGS
jgi:hypothetical protein